MTNLNLIIDDEELNFKIPDNWNDVTVGQYQEIIKIDKTNLTDIEILTKLLNTLTNIDEELIYQLPISEFNKIVTILEFTKDEIKITPKDFIIINGEEYWLKKDFESLTLGETISIEAIIKDKNIEEEIDKLLCVFLRKKKENGKLESFKNEFMERVELFKTIPISDIHNILVFFSNGRTSL